MAREDREGFLQPGGNPFALGAEGHDQRKQHQGRGRFPHQDEVVRVQVLQLDVVEIGYPRQNEHERQQAR